MPPITRLSVPTRVGATLALLALMFPRFACAQGFDKINTTVTNVNTILVTISIAVVTIAIIWAGFKMIYQGARLADVANVLTGRTLVGGAFRSCLWSSCSAPECCWSCGAGSW